MGRVLSIRNRQQTRAIHLPLLRRITRRVLAHHLGVAHFELCLHLIPSAEMIRMNEHFLGHAGSTDVITFDLNALEPSSSAPDSPGAAALRGEIFLSVDEAVRQGRVFRDAWPRELLRYVVHGLLHLHGFTDSRPTARRRMKREVDRLLRRIGREFDLVGLDRLQTSSRRPRAVKVSSP